MVTLALLQMQTPWAWRATAEMRCGYGTRSRSRIMAALLAAALAARRLFLQSPTARDCGRLAFSRAEPAQAQWCSQPCRLLTLAPCNHAATRGRRGDRVRGRERAEQWAKVSNRQGWLHHRSRARPATVPSGGSVTAGGYGTVQSFTYAHTTRAYGGGAGAAGGNSGPSGQTFSYDPLGTYVFSELHGGRAGYAISEGASLITWVNKGDVRGDEVL